MATAQTTYPSETRSLPEYLHKVASIAEEVTAGAARADARGQLDDSVVEELHRAGLFRLMLPVEDGGGGLGMGEALRVFEAMARLDGATGWNLCIGSMSLLFVSYGLREPSARRRILDDPRALVAGGGNPIDVRARKVPGGYVFDGRVGFASGSAHASWLVGLAAMVDANGMITDSSGSPVLLGGLIHPEAVTFEDSWHVVGLRGTGSRDFIVDELLVPEEMVFDFTRSAHGRDPLAALPVISRMGPGLAFVALGIAAHALDIVLGVATSKSPFLSSQPLAQRADVQSDVARARGSLAAARAYATTAWDSIEQAALAGVSPTLDGLAGLRLACITATELAATATDLAYRAGGSNSIYEKGALARCWRDIHTLTHHAAVSGRLLDKIGRVTLGLPPGPGIL